MEPRQLARTTDDCLRSIVAGDQAHVAERDVARQARELAAACAAAVADLARDRGKRYGPTVATLDRFRAKNDRQADVLARVRILADGVLEHVNRAGGVIFIGAPGTGKDHLLAALMYAAACRAVPCRWVRGADLYGDFREAIGGRGSEKKLIADLAEPRVLGLSDPIPPRDDPSPFLVGQFARLIDHRYSRNHVTWVTLNATAEAEVIDSLSAPVWRRLAENAEIFRCFWNCYEPDGRKA